MPEAPDSFALRLGAASGAAVAVLSVIYVAVLLVGLLTLPSPDQQIRQPWFTLLEGLILAIAPAIVMLAVALHGWTPAARKPLALAGVAFFSMCALLTCALHSSILLLSRHPAFAGEPWSSFVFSFRWPSLAYVIDILAWDVFYPIGTLFLAGAVQGRGLARLVRSLLNVSAALAFAGLLGVPLANMQVRNIGIIGYAVLLPVAAALLAAMFQRERSACAA